MFLEKLSVWLGTKNALSWASTWYFERTKGSKYSSNFEIAMHSQ